MPVGRLAMTISIGLCGCAAVFAKGSDLNPVSVRRSASHPPVVLVERGTPRGTICVMYPKNATPRPLAMAVADLRKFAREVTGADLPVVYNEVRTPAIVIGNCEQARSAGLDGTKMPVEGFAVKTVRDAVLIAGNDAPVPPSMQSNGTAWGVYEFIERFLDVRFYFPGDIGCSAPHRADLVLAPVWIEDAPFFRKREIWPSSGHGESKDVLPHHLRLRSADTWPVRLVVHAPHDLSPEYGKTRPEIFEYQRDGTRNTAMLCYGNPLTLQTYLENIERHYERGEKTRLGIVGNAITVSPNDIEYHCLCEHCRKLWDPDGGLYGTASRVVGQFVADLGREIRKRWPDKVVIYLPYKNYTRPPKGVVFPDNVHIQLCGMPGLAAYKEQAVFDAEQGNIDEWIRLTGHRIQNWHYSCWPEDQTKACYFFPETIRRHYRANRNKTVGSFINGVNDHWPRQNLSLYVWLKVLWNPDFDVDAAIGEYVRRMFGPAAGTMGRLIAMQIAGWEKSRWPQPRVSPKAVYEFSYPRADVVAMEALLRKAVDEAKADDLVSKRLAYLVGPLEEFFTESREYAEGTGKTVLVARKVAETPVLDGRLDDPVWQRAEEVSFVRAMDRQNKTPKYPTRAKAVWTLTGVTFGFLMEEPAPAALARKYVDRDASLMWWDDNIELFLDVTGQRQDYYQFIINPNGAVYDTRNGDLSWNTDAVTCKAFTGNSFWSVELHIPFSAFKEMLVPQTGVVWYANASRHRVCDGKDREHTRLNTSYQSMNRDMSAFGPVKFVE